MPVGGVQAPAPRGAEHERVWLAGEPVAAEMLFEYLCDQTRQRYGAAPGGCRGFGPVAAHLGGGFGHLQLVVRDFDSSYTQAGDFGEAQTAFQIRI